MRQLCFCRQDRTKQRRQRRNKSTYRLLTIASGGSQGMGQELGSRWIFKITQGAFAQESERERRWPDGPSIPIIKDVNAQAVVNRRQACAASEAEATVHGSSRGDVIFGNAKACPPSFHR